MSKSITVTWRSDKIRGKQCLSRFKFHDCDLGIILHLLSKLQGPHLIFVGLHPSRWRASRAGKLIVRLAT